MGKNLKNHFLGDDIIVLHAALAFILFARYRLFGGIGDIKPYWQAN